MIAQWTGDVVGQMHNANITAKQLAAEIGWNEKYLSQVLNCRVSPKNAEEKVRAALNRIVNQASQGSSDTPTS